MQATKVRRHVFIPWDQWAEGLGQSKAAGQTDKFDSAEAATSKSDNYSVR